MRWLLALGGSAVLGAFLACSSESPGAPGGTPAADGGAADGTVAGQRDGASYDGGALSGFAASDLVFRTYVQP